MVAVVPNRIFSSLSALLSTRLNWTFSLRRLSPELLAVVQATILDGLTVREASRLLGLPTGTVKTRLMRAKRILREQLT